MSRRAVTTIGILGAAGAGYYFYNAGGNPKVAQKLAEHDAAKISNKVQSGLPGSGKEFQKAGEDYAARAGAELDKAVSEAKTKGRELDSKLNSAAHDAEKKYQQLKAEAGAKFDETRKDANQKIAKFDQTVEKKAVEAKSGISSWFGFGGSK